jgi:hypothetical protein
MLRQYQLKKDFMYAPEPQDKSETPAIVYLFSLFTITLRNGRITISSLKLMAPSNLGRIPITGDLEAKIDVKNY